MNKTYVYTIDVRDPLCFDQLKYTLYSDTPYTQDGFNELVKDAISKTIKDLHAKRALYYDSSIQDIVQTIEFISNIREIGGFKLKANQAEFDYSEGHLRPFIDETPFSSIAKSQVPLEELTKALDSFSKDIVFSTINKESK